MFPTPLSQPVGALMRPLPSVFPEASLEAAAAVLRDSGCPLVAISDGASLEGILTEASLAEALSRGALPTEPASLAATPTGGTLRPYMSGAEALRAFSGHFHSAFVVTDDYGRPIGVLTPSDLFPKAPKRPSPTRVGGMATPFGVYLTTGNLGAGAGGFALVSTGMLLGTLLILASALGTVLARQVPGQYANFVFDAVPVILFFLGMRLLPLAGIHAAEHMVVHAIERGEELKPEIIKRMPRVHPRCGTNLAVGAMLFFAIAGATWIPYLELRAGLALIATLALWRPLGGFVQYWVTTRKPTAKHIDLGIKAGKELLERFEKGGETKRTFLGYIWNTGLLHVMLGAYTVVGIGQALDWYFGWRLFV
jgi:CBS domain-containing protein